MDILDNLGTGLFLKQGKHLNRCLIDPFVLALTDGQLVAQRSDRRMLFMNQAPYTLLNLHVSPLRSLSEGEYCSLVASEHKGRLEETFSIVHAKCFDIRFGPPDKETTMAVFAVYASTVP